MIQVRSCQVPPPSSLYTSISFPDEGAINFSEKIGDAVKYKNQNCKDTHCLVVNQAGWTKAALKKLREWTQACLKSEQFSLTKDKTSPLIYILTIFYQK